MAHGGPAIVYILNNSNNPGDFTMPYFAFTIAYPLWLYQQMTKFWVDLLRGEGVKTEKTPE